MRDLKTPCSHGRYDDHFDYDTDEPCPGGVLLPPGSFSEFEMEDDDGVKRRYLIVALDALAAAQMAERHHLGDGF